MYNYPEVLLSLPSVHHVPGLRSGYDVPSYDDGKRYYCVPPQFCTHQCPSFPRDFSVGTGMQTKNLPLTNSLLQNDYAESIFVFNGERDVSEMPLPEEMLLTGNAESER
ncbi:TPA: hypothetical protein ACWXQQ_004734 [Escherichia coli]